MNIIHEYLSTSISYRGLAIKYNIPSDTITRDWVLKHTNRKENEALKAQNKFLEIENEVFKKAISEVYHQYRGIYVYRRITIYLNHSKKMKVNHKCIYRLMRLEAMIRRRKYNYRRSKAIHVSENLLNRKFTANKAYQKLLTDISKFQLTNGQKVYLSAVLDLGTNKIVPHELGHSNNNPLVLNTFKQIYSKNNSR